MKKSERFALVLTPTEKEVIALLAKERGGLSQSALIRCLIHDAARASGLLLNALTSESETTYEQN